MIYYLFIISVILQVSTTASVHEKTGIECNLNLCHLPYGKCSEDKKTCVCQVGYAQYPESLEVLCSYSLQNAKSYILYESLLGFGVGHFVAGKYIMGIFKLILGLTSLIMFIVLLCMWTKDLDKNGCKLFVLTIISVSFLGLYLIFYAVDLALIALNVYKDGNGLPLFHWNN